MISGRTECALAVLAAFCVLVVFFFPALQGPYPAVHGPVTALLSLRAALRLGIIRNGVRPIYARAARVRVAMLALQRADFFLLYFGPENFSAALGSILRC
jgi:hypothetical protein